MNKNTKIWVNYIAGGAISLVLLWSIYTQLLKQVSGVSTDAWKHTGWNGYLVLSVSLMGVNLLLESGKWYLLSNSAAQVSYPRAFASYLAGIAISLVTPNRIGDYPARILYLGATNTFRYINVSILGLVSQLSAIFLFGLAGLIHFNIFFPSYPVRIALVVCAVANVLIVLVYWKFEKWLPLLEKVSFLRRFAIYGRLLNRFPASRQAGILALSILRFSVFTAQYLFLLRWMNVNIPLADGFLTAALFFWAMAVIPSIALTGIAIRTKLSMLLFGSYSANMVGIVAATVGIWIINLVVPAIVGSILMIRMRLLR